MTHAMPSKIGLNEWDIRYGQLKEDGLQEPSYGGILRRHFDDGDCRLGTVPVIAYSFPGITAFYPDGAWWIPCVMQLSAGLLEVADSLGINESFCPVRAMIGAFVTGNHFRCRTCSSAVPVLRATTFRP